NNIFTKKGRLVSGIIVEETDRAVTVQTLTERVVVPKVDIEERQVSNVSMMPEGQLEKLKPDELRDLVAYLASKKQVPLPKEQQPRPKTGCLPCRFLLVVEALAAVQTQRPLRRLQLGPLRRTVRCQEARHCHQDVLALRSLLPLAVLQNPGFEHLE